MLKGATLLRITFVRIIYILILLFAFQIKSKSQDKFNKTITGRILDTITKKPIVDVIVVNKNTNKTTLTDNDGYFNIAVGQQDSLIFYLIGYYSKIYQPNTEDFKKQVLVFFLKPNIEELHQIEVTAMRKQEKTKFPFNQTPATAFSPISFLYEKYSKKYQQYRKIEALEQQKYYEHLRESRFSKELVMEITGIPKDEVDKFMKQMKFDNDFLLHASDYDFIVAIQKKYKYYSDRR